MYGLTFNDLHLQQDYSPVSQPSLHSLYPASSKKMYVKVLIFLGFVLLCAVAILSTNGAESQLKNTQESGYIKRVRASVLKRMDRNEVQSGVKSLKEWASEAIAYIDPPMPYINISSYQKMLERNQKMFQIPFCVIVMPPFDQNAYEKIISSVLVQKYSNLKIKVLSSSKDKIQINPNIQFIQTHSQGVSGQELANAILKCQDQSAVVILNQELKVQALRTLNQVYQKFNVWAIFQKIEQSVQVLGFYRRAFDLFLKNDFHNQNVPLFMKNIFSSQKKSNLSSLIIISLLELYPQNSYFFQSNKISTQTLQWPFNLPSKNLQQKVQRTPYQPIDSLSQDHPIRIKQLNAHLYRFIKDSPYEVMMQWHKHRSGVTMTQLLKAKQYEQLLYLPKEHLLNFREKVEIGDKIVNEEESNDNNNIVFGETTRFCVTILSHNNIQNSRYKKVLQSILQQNYTNYHIVFVDDMSSDQNMQKTKQYLKEKKFTRATFVQNLHRKFGTYNIIRAAFMQCQPNQVQMLVDGDDQLIGKQAFQILNKVYLTKPKIQVVYSTYKQNIYAYGDSGPFSSPSLMRIPFINRRTYMHLLSPIRSWRVSAVRLVPLQASMDEGEWFDTGYDDLLQYPLFQIVGIQQIYYLQQILYLANKEYGDNDDSNKSKVDHRVELIAKVLKRSPYKQSNLKPNYEQEQKAISYFQNQTGIQFTVSNS